MLSIFNKIKTKLHHKQKIDYTYLFIYPKKKYKHHDVNVFKECLMQWYLNEQNIKEDNGKGQHCIKSPFKYIVHGDINAKKQTDFFFFVKLSPEDIKKYKLENVVYYSNNIKKQDKIDLSNFQIS